MAISLSFIIIVVALVVVSLVFVGSVIGLALFVNSKTKEPH